VPNVLKSGSLNLLEPSGLVKACDGIAFYTIAFLYYCFFILLLFYIIAFLYYFYTIDNTMVWVRQKDARGENTKINFMEWISQERGRRGRPRKTWLEGNQADMTTRNLEPDQWRNGGGMAFGFWKTATAVIKPDR
jgi:hypothetical protein